MGLRIEENLRMLHPVCGRAAEVSEGEIVKIALGMEHRGSLIVDVEEILEVRETVGRAHRLH